MKVCIKTAGCSLNFADSEQMAGLLKEAGFEIVNSLKNADLIILNTCTVKTPTENKFFNFLEKIKTLNKPIIVAGCIPQTDSKKLKGYPLIGTRQIDNIVQVVEETINDNIITALSVKDHPCLSPYRIRKNPIIEIIPICRGCLGNCTYCKVKLARGHLKSYKIEDIKKRFKLALRQGAKEIWLTAQDTGCYGLDIKTNLPTLLKELTQIPGNYKIRIGMMNPNHVLQFLDELIQIYKNEKIFKFLHLPVQSGNNEILKSMNRKYLAEDFRNIVKKFRQPLPEITLATDIIAGFPGETEKQFDNTLDIIKQTTPAVINISRFWPREKTKAAKMENQIHSKHTKERSRMLTHIYHNIARMQNERWLNWEGSVIVDEIGKDNSFVARNYAYKPVIVKGNYNLGETVKVKIKKVTSFDLRAQ
ncbi:MAG: tRNA (N(6)-L-threonylcarbamoyladenosine(37)-C(2))-methylthiotransferase [Nanoarchaeota archaeon]|nr:tRNA (N(6)-L-threonylcarbamoyladenosine(37)-C(2))-methylthiotransferase [Nanoarchaeota archaeon]